MMSLCQLLLCNLGGRIISGFKVIEGVPSDAPLQVARSKRSPVRIWLKLFILVTIIEVVLESQKNKRNEPLTYGSLG